MDTVVSHRRKKPRGGNHERWLVSYADLVTLLFAVFAMMYAISNVDAEKLARLVSTMQVVFDSGGGGIGPPLGPNPEGDLESFLDGVDQDLVNLRQGLLGRLSAQINQDRVDLTLDERGLVISIREAGSFDLGSADLSGVAESIIAEVAATLVGVRNPVMVEGHTDNVPISTARFASNWELSTGRATAVIAFLIERMGVAPSRLSAAGYGEFRPRADNDTPGNRALNRRVDIVIQRAAKSGGVEPEL
jgi:chemotaxis protein MotB